MSLIEKAIEKMQQSQRHAGTNVGVMHSTGAGPYGKIVTTVRGSESGRSVQPPARVIEINEGALRRAGLLPPEHQARQIGRQYQQIKRPLIANAFGRAGEHVPFGQLVMIASAAPGEGKTFTALNLAFSMALEKDIEVVLADADLPKPHISTLLGVEREPGLLDVLQDPARDIESVILPTTIRALSILPAGTRAENSTELLASERMRALVARLAANAPNRIVLFDSPPLLLTSEAHALSEVCGQVVVIVRAAETPQRTVLDALSHIAAGRQVSLVLNQSVAQSTTNYYYYGIDTEGQGGARTG